MEAVERETMDELDITLIARRSVHGVFALISRQFILQLISLGAFFLISSLLRVSDIGIYTAVIAIQRIINFFTDFGLGAALVQKKEHITQNDITTSFTIQMGSTLLIFLLVFLFQGYIASFFKLNNAGIRLLLVLVFSIFLSSFKTIPSILLERKIHFSKLVIPQIIESFTFNVILVVLVLRKFGIDSYSWAFLISSIVGIPCYYYVSPWKIRIGISKESLKHLKFGAQFQAKNILATIKDDLLTVILIKFLSFTEIGYIGFAQRIAFFVFRYIVDSVTKVTFSTYSRIQIHSQHLRQAVEKSLFFVSATMFPILAGIIITAPYFVRYFPRWHNKWEPALFSLLFFCLNAMVSSISNILVNVLDATGQVKTTLKLMVLWTTLTWILTPLFIFTMGYNGVAVASFLVTLTIVFTVYLTKKIVQFDLFKNIYKPVIAVILMSLFVAFLAQIIAVSLFSLFVVIVLSGLFYSGILYAIAKNDLHTDFKKIFIKN